MIQQEAKSTCNYKLQLDQVFTHIVADIYSFKKFPIQWRTGKFKIINFHATT